MGKLDSIPNIIIPNAAKTRGSIAESLSNAAEPMAWRH